MAVFSRAPITAAENLLLSQINDYNNWKTAGRWASVQEMSGTMLCTWAGGRTRKSLCRPVEHSGGAAGAKPLAFLLGDFNSEADVRGEGYDLILRSGWQDTYRLARQRDDGYTVVQAIDAGGMLRTRLPKNALTRSGAPRRCRCTAAGWYSAENRSPGSPTMRAF